jgi:hypothetical protein
MWFASRASAAVSRYASGFTAPLGRMILTKGGDCFRTARTTWARPFVKASICSTAVSVALEK